MMSYTDRDRRQLGGNEPPAGGLRAGSDETNTDESRSSQDSNDPLTKSEQPFDAKSVGSDYQSLKIPDIKASKCSQSISCVSRDSLDNATESNISPRPWSSGFIRFGPLTGIFAMFCAISSLFASLGILVGSQGAPTSSWPAEPSIYIATFTAIANLSVRYACVHGVVITWWTRAIQGSSIAKLHHDWRTGSTLHGALTAGCRMGLLGLACIFATIVVIDGPLLQRATRVKSAPLDTTHTLHVTMAPEVPNSWSGVWNDWKGPMYWRDAFNRTAPTAGGQTTSTTIIPTYFNGLADQLWAHTWLARNPIGSEFIQGCSHSCQTAIRAPALAATMCQNSMIPFKPTSQNLTYFLNTNRAYPLTADVFIIDFEFMPASVERGEKVDLITAFTKQEGNCAGLLNMTVCTLESAIGEYNISISDNTVTLGQPSIVALANSMAGIHSKSCSCTYHYTDTRGERQWNDIAQGWNSTLAGIVGMATEYWFDGVAMVTGRDGQLKPSFRGAGQDQQYQHYGVPPSDCPSYSDPHEDVMQSLNELMFLTGIQATRYMGKDYLESHMDPGLSIHSKVVGYPQGDHNVFHSDYRWFAAAAIVEIICIAFVAPTYWGWWKLGRSLSLSPIETAKAFESPILVDCNSNSSARDICEQVGHIRLQYGAVQSGGRTKLALVSPEFAHPPRGGCRFEV